MTNTAMVTFPLPIGPTGVSCPPWLFVAHVASELGLAAQRSPSMIVSPAMRVRVRPETIMVRSLALARSGARRDHEPGRNRSAPETKEGAP
jgi:hypothetical protein